MRFVTEAHTYFLKIIALVLKTLLKSLSFIFLHRHEPCSSLTFFTVPSQRHFNIVPKIAAVSCCFQEQVKRESMGFCQKNSGNIALFSRISNSV